MLYQIRFKSLSIVVLLMLASCTDLNQVNPNTLTEDSFWQTEQDVRQGVYATYDMLQRWGLYTNQFRVLPTLISDEGTNEYPFEFYDIARFNIQDGEFFTSIWIHHYGLIGRGYQVLENADDAEGDEGNIEGMKGEASFLIALGYYNLIQAFGEQIAYVTLVQQPGDRPPRAEPGQLWTLIEEKLTFAAGTLPESYSESEYGRATAGAALSLLGKAHMQQHEWSEAEQVLNRVITEHDYEVLDNYNDNFTEAVQPNPESIFQVNFKPSQNFEDTERARWYMATGLNQKGGFQDLQPTNFVHDEFMNETDLEGNPDPRMSKTIFYEGHPGTFWGEPFSFYDDWPNENVKFAWYKYSEQQNVGNGFADETQGGTDFIVIRYADILLSYAEVLNELGRTGDAYQYVDQVRRRSNMEPLSTAKPNLNQDQFLEQLQHERVVELAGEAVRWFDLKRWGIYNSDLGTDPNFADFTESQDELLPIPQSELDLNPNLKQNPGF